jgi:ribose transport system permease protein
LTDEISTTPDADPSVATFSDELISSPTGQAMTRPLPDARTWRNLLLHRATLIAALDAVVVIGVGIAQPSFLSWSNFSSLFNNMALPAIVLVPNVFLLGAGRFDLSPDGVSALSGVVSGEILIHTGLGTAGGIVAGLAVGVAIGVVNGVLVERTGLNPLIVTLGTWWIAAGTALGVTKGTDVVEFPNAFQNIGGATVGGMLITTWYAVPVLVLGALVLSFTRFGAHTLGTGGNREAARLNGIRVRRIGIGLYAASALASAFAGVMFAGRLDSATSNPFTGLALQVIAAAVIGGSSLYGGRGTVLGALFGLLLLNLISDSTIYLGISTYWEQTITGAVLLVAVYGDIVADRTTGGSMRHWRGRLAHLARPG